VSRYRSWYVSLAGALLLAMAFLVSIEAGTAARAAGRLALVVGNADYRSVVPLNNPVNDSHAVAEVLKQLGFDVTLVDNAGQHEFRNAVEAFRQAAGGAAAAVFYYSGHGFQLRGVNYLVPTDASLKSVDALGKETISLDWVVSELQTLDRQTLIFMDACRTNPLPESMREAGGTEGLAQMETGTGTFVAFATQPGNITRDGPGENSPFTRALVEHLPSRGISISDVMIRVRNSVAKATGHQQVPWDQSSLRSQFYFHPLGELTIDSEEEVALDASGSQGGSDAGGNDPVTGRLIILPVGSKGRLASEFGKDTAAAPEASRPSDSGKVVGALSIEPADKPAEPPREADEVAFWERISESTDPADFRRYLEMYPKGSFARIAELNVKALEKLGETERRVKELEIAQKAGQEEALGLEELYWGTIRESDIVADFESYLRAFPAGAFADLAQARIEALSHAKEIVDLTKASSASPSRLRAAAMRQYEKIPTQFLQYGLVALGYPIPTISGTVDSDTRKSIRAYQASVGAAQTGKLTAQQSVDLLLAAATVGDEHAQTAIGIMMATGQGLHRDFVFARLWLKHAADQGNPYAQANLAILYRDGLGGKKDVAAARQLLAKAASAGVAEAAEVLKDLKG